MTVNHDSFSKEKIDWRKHFDNMLLELHVLELQNKKAFVRKLRFSRAKHPPGLE